MTNILIAMILNSSTQLTLTNWALIAMSKTSPLKSKIRRCFTSNDVNILYNVLNDICKQVLESSMNPNFELKGKKPGEIKKFLETHFQMSLQINEPIGRVILFLMFISYGLSTQEVNPFFLEVCQKLSEDEQDFLVGLISILTMNDNDYREVLLRGAITDATKRSARSEHRKVADLLNKMKTNNVRNLSENDHESNYTKSEDHAAKEDIKNERNSSNVIEFEKRMAYLIQDNKRLKDELSIKTKSCSDALMNLKSLIEQNEHLKVELSLERQKVKDIAESKECLRLQLEEVTEKLCQLEKLA
ncbi:hypothetical protein ACOME3_006483 [Neoechinorhynchus agilis]